MSKYLGPNDTHFTINTVHSKLTLDSGSDGIKTVAFNSSSNNDDSSSYYNVLNHLFYRTNHFGGNGTFSGKGILYPYSEENVNPQHRNKFNTNGILLSISSSEYGRRIQPGTFIYTDTSQAKSITIKDDGYGNLYPSNAIISQSGDTSISSSDNYIGNIFYEHGLAMITETGSFSESVSYTGSGVNYSMSFETTMDIYTYEYSCTLGSNEYNQTMNRSILNTTSSITQYYEDQSLSTVGYHDLSDIGVYPKVPGYQVTRSIVNLDSNVIKSKFRKDTFRTYITKIGLFNEEGEMIMIGSLSQPLQKMVDHPMTIKIQMDF
jgi:hypothetical protein